MCKLSVKYTLNFKIIDQTNDFDYIPHQDYILITNNFQIAFAKASGNKMNIQNKNSSLFHVAQCQLFHVSYTQKIGGYFFFRMAEENRLQSLVH